MTTTAPSAPERFAIANPQLSLGLMLLALHGSIAWGIEEWWPRAFLLVHLGLFLLWQPVWRGEREIAPSHAFSVIAVACLLVGWYNWWLMALWLAVLVGLIGGSVPRLGDRRQRLISTLAVLYLLSMLLVGVVPQLFVGQSTEPPITALVRFVLPVLPLVIAFIRTPLREPENPVGVDLFYSLLLFLLVLALVLGSFVIREVSHGIYVIALAQTLFAIAVILLGLSWLWYPHSGFTGVGFLLSSYLMSMGLPFERWVQRLAQLAQEETRPERFLANALEHMLDLPWVKRVEWRTPLSQGEFGVRTPHSSAVAFGELELFIHTPWAPSPSILLHLKLLTQMVGYFYEAKQREHMQRQNAYTYAIYETGARLTHDVKNLLQSLKSLCAAAAGATPEQAPALHALIQRQLPQITQRLNTTLDKLRSPLAAEMNEVDAAEWWDHLLQRYAGRNVVFGIDGEMRPLRIAGELFDNVADNLIENAFNKSADRRNLQVRVTFSADGRGTLSVCDNGAALPQAVAGQLFEGPVLSHTGFGVGLYQSSRLAAQSGYRLTLAANRAGSVCFVLESEPGADAALPDRHVA